MKIAAIVGPTATGKTRLAVALAHEFGSEIVSADSRQVYRGLDLGTGKDLEEYAAVDPPVPYHLIDVADPRERYTLFHYLRDVRQILHRLADRPPFADNDVPVVLVGGSGLYVEGILRDYRIADVPVNADLRSRLEMLSRQTLIERLRIESPGILAETDCSSRRRLIRGLEIAAAERKGPVTYCESSGLDLDIVVLKLRIDRVRLRARIAERLKHRLEAGMIDEVRGLLERGLPPERLESLGLEYREIGRYLAGRTTYRSMVVTLQTRIGQFAKRQETWFRGMARRGLPVREISIGDVDGAMGIIERWCTGGLSESDI